MRDVLHRQCLNKTAFPRHSRKPWAGSLRLEQGDPAAAGISSTTIIGDLMLVIWDLQRVVFSQRAVERELLQNAGAGIF